MDDSIVSQKTIDKARKEAEVRFKQFTTEEIIILRRKAKTNLFFLASGVLGYNKLTNGLHLDFCKWAKRTLASQFREALLPRAHYKSTIFTISDGVQIVLPDDQGDQPYPRNLGTDCRLLLSHETSEASARFLYSITSHFTGNPLLIGLFPETVPNPRRHRINKLELELPRAGIWSEPTIDTVGVAGKSQGRHYNYVKCDDLYGAAARDSKAERESTILWVDNLHSLLVSPRTDHIDFVGTRWAHDDVYAHIHKVYGDKLVKYIRACEEFNPKTQRRESIFPEEFPPESLEILKKNRIVWNSQYANNPFEGGSLFQEEWLRYYNVLDKFRRKLVVFDTKADSTHRRINVEELDRVILVDPAMSGLTGFVVTGTDYKTNVYVLEAEKREWGPPEFVEKLFLSVLRWRPRMVVIEEVLFSGLYQHWLQREQQIRGIKFRVEQVKVGKTEKQARVLGLSNWFSGGQIYFPLDNVELMEEYKEFGATENYHMLDAMAMGIKKDKEGRQIWRAALSMDMINKSREAERKLMEARDPETGYGTI